MTAEQEARWIAAQERQAAAIEAQVTLGEAAAAQDLRRIEALERQATAAEGHVAALIDASKANVAAFADTRRADFLSCLRAAAEARIENEPALLLKAADSLMAGLDDRFPA